MVCSAFLWNGKSHSAKGAKVSWSNVCSPRHCGGLGLRKLEEWNKVYGLKLIWMLLTKSGSLWVAWHKENLLKRNILWDANFNTKGSWVWRRVMKLRTIASDFIICRIKAGNKVSFWHDNWSGHGSLIKLVGREGPLVTGIRSNDTINPAVINGRWKLYAGRSPIVNRLRGLIPISPPPLDNQDSDEYLWKNRNGPSTFFSSQETWSQLSPNLPTVQWHKAIWFSKHIPKHAFITWLAASNRLPTRDQMQRWGWVGRMKCIICGRETNTVDHLFLLCRTSTTIGRTLMGLDYAQGQSTITGLLERLALDNTKQDEIKIKMMLSQAMVYEVWKERNHRMHDHEWRRTEDIIKTILSTIKGKLIPVSLTSKSTSAVSLLGLWFRKFQLLQGQMYTTAPPS